ncbi:helix-turn-helix transcriptional regulator [Clostridium algidicarnis]|nr:helix-turn-helix transcriptional regulator [Clostridium algidicarnis]MBU3202795.1 winged helix-turn-helix transcriptional regulator [Clostridium algidicarnis]MBU3210949.1 winged helix-turn-helix transcriptional regulator [Clostridium algidicarnis]MBU3222543.1 winged helix-turn-helix transcriptional regulator [Clostridium algidicarnis]
MERKVYNEIPPKVEYSLSPIGKEFTTVMESMKQWGNSYIHNLNIKN